MSKPKEVWTLPELLDRIWMLSRGKRTAVYSGEARPVKLGNGMLDAQLHTKRVVTGWDEDYKPRTYELNKISAASAAALYERIKTMRAKGALLTEPIYYDWAISPAEVYGRLASGWKLWGSPCANDGGVVQAMVFHGETP